MALYVPGLENILAVVITWGIAAALLLIGTALCGSRVGLEYRIGAGWGALCIVLTLWGVFVPLSLRVPAVAIIVGAVAVQLLPGRRVTRAD
ncbi:MAG TPA: hypothetical protein VGR70_12900, partial [Stellaceae bacterium]|nr:hypothetical protein [Stellaceae bacterium]